MSPLVSGRLIPLLVVVSPVKVGSGRCDLGPKGEGERRRGKKQTLNRLKLRNLRDRDNELAADDTEGKGGEEGKQRERTF